MMVANHIVYNIDLSTGGPARSVTQLVEALAVEDQSLRLNLFANHSPNPIISGFINGNSSLYFSDSWRNIGWNLNDAKGISDNDVIYHGHCLWQLPVHHMAVTARRHNIPYIISPRGMLEPWSLRQKWLKKKLALWLYQFRDLKKASCLHATCSMEARNFRALGLTNPIAVIPNGIPLEDFPLKTPVKKEGPRKVLFLSRIHPKKGIENLIDAWSLLPVDLTRNWRVDIIGNGDAAYLESLRSRIAGNGLSDSLFIGDPIFGKEKSLAYQEADLFILPTYSENFGIVVAEALASGTAVITTKGAPWEDLEVSGSGWWVETGVPAMEQVLLQALSLPQERLDQMGLIGRKLVERKYSIEATARNMQELYDWILNKTAKPDFVLT